MLKLRNAICTLGVLFMVTFHIMMPLFPPPERLFDLYWAVNNAFSFGVFAMMSLYAHNMMHENKH